MRRCSGQDVSTRYGLFADRRAGSVVVGIVFMVLIETHSLPIRPMTPAPASIASLSVVFPDDAWPTMAKLRRSPAEGVTINQARADSKHASNSPWTQAEIWLSEIISRRAFASKLNCNPGIATGDASKGG
jgi:hypothetical protein